MYKIHFDTLISYTVFSNNIVSKINKIRAIKMLFDIILA